MQTVQAIILDFVDHELSLEEYGNLKEKITNLAICDEIHEFRLFLHMFLKISNNFHFKIGQFNKFLQILKIFKKDIKEKFTDKEFFNIFKSNNRIILFLLEEKMIQMDKSIAKKIINDKNLKIQYFLPELQPFMNEKWFPDDLKEEVNKEIPENYYEKRRNGQNDNYICELIQNDSIEDFIVFVNKNNYPLNSIISPSIYETNHFLLKQTKISLIGYAVFYESIQILKYLILNKVKLRQYLWFYAIHSNNAEVINILEENNNKPDEIALNKCLKESIKCHHIDISNYILGNYIYDEKQTDVLIDCIKYYNFAFMQNDINKNCAFYYFCKYDYYFFVDIFLREFKVDVNQLIILKLILK